MDVAVDASLRAMAEGVAQGGASARPDRMPYAALRRRVRTRAEQALYVFVVDASESMAERERMAVAKGAALALLQTAYVRRDRVAVIVFEGESARVVLEPTASTERAEEALRRLAVGGATPLSAGLRLGWELACAERRRDRGVVPTLVLLSDGSGNVPIVPGADPHREAICLSERIREDLLTVFVVDTDRTRPPRPALVEIASALGTTVFRLGYGGTAALVSALRSEVR